MYKSVTRSLAWGSLESRRGREAANPEVMFNKVGDCIAGGTAVSDLLEPNIKKKVLVRVFHRGHPEGVKSGRHFSAGESLEQRPETVVC